MRQEEGTGECWDAYLDLAPYYYQPMHANTQYNIRLPLFLIMLNLFDTHVETNFFEIYITKINSLHKKRDIYYF